MGAPSRRGRALVGLVGILLLALGIRAWGLGFGLPYLYHPDEPDKVAIAQRMFATGDLNPHYFKKPTLFLYLNAAAYIPYYLIQRSRGQLHAVSDIEAPEVLVMGVGRTSQPDTMLLARGVTAAFGLLAVLLVFLVAKRLAGDRRVALLAALLMALSPTAVNHSRFVTVDMFLVCSVLMVALFSLAVYDRGRTRDYLLAGAFVGIAAACKYPGVTSIVALAAAHFLRPGGGALRDRRLVLAGIAAPAAFLLVTPYALLDYAEFYQQAHYEADHYTTGHVGMEGSAPEWYAAYSIREEGLAVALGAIAAAVAVSRRRRRELAFVAYPLSYFLFISLLAVRNDRTLLPALPFAFVMASALLVELWRGARGLAPGIGRHLATAAALALLAVCVAYPAGRACAAAWALDAPDSRATAAAWIEANVPPGTSVAIESYAPYVDPAKYNVHAVKSLADQPDDWFVANSIQLVVFGQDMYGRFFDEPDRYPVEAERYRDLFDRLEPVRIFTDGPYEVRIYRWPAAVSGSPRPVDTRRGSGRWSA